MYEAFFQDRSHDGSEIKFKKIETIQSIFSMINKMKKKSREEGNQKPHIYVEIK